MVGNSPLFDTSKRVLFHSSLSPSSIQHGRKIERSTADAVAAKRAKDAPKIVAYTETNRKIAEKVGSGRGSLDRAVDVWLRSDDFTLPDSFPPNSGQPVNWTKTVFSLHRLFCLKIRRVIPRGTCVENVWKPFLRAREPLASLSCSFACQTRTPTLTYPPQRPAH